MHLFHCFCCERHLFARIQTALLHISLGGWIVFQNQCIWWFVALVGMTVSPGTDSLYFLRIVVRQKQYWSCIWLINAQGQKWSAVAEHACTFMKKNQQCIQCIIFSTFRSQTMSLLSDQHQVKLLNSFFNFYIESYYIIFISLHNDLLLASKFSSSNQKHQTVFILPWGHNRTSPFWDKWDFSVSFSSSHWKIKSN